VLGVVAALVPSARRRAYWLTGGLVLIGATRMAFTPDVTWSLLAMALGAAGTVGLAISGDGSTVTGYSGSTATGEDNLAFYEAHNPTDRPVAGQATFNVVPYSAGGYFAKVQCFCFTEQVLGPGETAQMPVSFYVDPAILEDPEGRYVREITLGYTFYEIDLPEEEAHAALDPVPASGGPLTADGQASID